MEISLRLWFGNDDYIRYKIVLPADNFTNCPTKEVRITSGLQVIKSAMGYRLTTFGDSRRGWLAMAGVVPTGKSWDDGDKRYSIQDSTPWMKKKDLIAVLERIIPMEIATWDGNALIKEEFRNLIIK